MYSGYIKAKMEGLYESWLVVHEDLARHSIIELISGS